jgi:RimJ/RimL family protein N-acetyltransferase
MIIETPRLIMRPMEIYDGEKVVEWRNSSHIKEMNFSDKNKILTLNEHLKWFESTRKKRIDYIVEVKESKKPIGSFSYVFLEDGEFGGSSKTAEIGKYIGEKSQKGKGYASEASRHWLKYGFETMNFDLIISKTKNINLSNIHINEKVGFSKSKWPDSLSHLSEYWLLMKLTRENWELSN